MAYITVADVDAILGAGWAGQGDPGRAVMMANTWLAAKIRKAVAVPTPEPIKQAGAEIAKEAAAGRIYQASEREVTSTEVSAQPGTFVKKSFAAGSKELTTGENFALALIDPWTRRSGVFMLQRI
jgi:hypothetical protein